MGFDVVDEIRKDISEVFRRLSKVETDAALFTKAEKELKEDIKDLKDLVSKKLDEYSEKQDKQTKFMYIITGMGIILQIVVLPIIIGVAIFFITK